MADFSKFRTSIGGFERFDLLLERGILLFRYLQLRCFAFQLRLGGRKLRFERCFLRFQLLGENGRKQVMDDLCIKKAVEFVVENAKEDKPKKTAAKKTTKKAKDEAPAEENGEEA